MIRCCFWVRSNYQICSKSELTCRTQLVHVSRRISYYSTWVMSQMWNCFFARIILIRHSNILKKLSILQWISHMKYPWINQRFYRFQMRYSRRSIHIWFSAWMGCRCWLMSSCSFLEDACKIWHIWRFNSEIASCIFVIWRVSLRD